MSGCMCEKTEEEEEEEWTRRTEIKDEGYERDKQGA